MLFKLLDNGQSVIGHFPAKLAILSDQPKFDQTNLLYIINGEVNEFTKEK